MALAQAIQKYRILSNSKTVSLLPTQVEVCCGLTDVTLEPHCSDLVPETEDQDCGVRMEQPNLLVFGGQEPLTDVHIGRENGSLMLRTELFR